MNEDTLNQIGIILGLVGTLLLFMYGMPARIPNKGMNVFHSSDPNPTDSFIDKVYKIFGWVGLIFLITGSGLQLFATYSHPK
jgi:hypothetical protein